MTDRHTIQVGTDRDIIGLRREGRGSCCKQIARPHSRPLIRPSATFSPKLRCGGEGTWHSHPAFGSPKGFATLRPWGRRILDTLNHSDRTGTEFSRAIVSLNMFTTVGRDSCRAENVLWLGGSLALPEPRPPGASPSRRLAPSRCCATRPVPRFACELVRQAQVFITPASGCRAYDYDHANSGPQAALCGV